MPSAKSTAVKPKPYVYGVGLGAHGQLIPYVYRHRRVNVHHPDMVTVLEECTTVATPATAERLRGELLAAWRKRIAADPTSATRNARPIASTSEAGRLAVHADSDGVHVAVLLDTTTPEATLALVLTSHSHWARQARPITVEERDIIAPNARPGTRVASVIRPRHEFTLREGELPAWRVEALLAEFTREKAS